VKKQRSTDTLLQLPVVLFAALMVFFAVVSLFAKDWRLAGIFVITAMGSLLRLRMARRVGIRGHEEDRRAVLAYAGQPFEKALASIREIAVPIPGTIAFPARFMSRGGVGRFYYFEWHEIVFRVESDAVGKMLVAVRDDASVAPAPHLDRKISLASDSTTSVRSP
jgi:hypothetical protein